MEEQLAELGLLAALVLGLILGSKHSLDPDHVVAVSTIVSEYKNPLRSFWVGISWGLGHTTTLLIIGIVIIALRLTIPERMALLFEFAVGVMLVALGAQVIYSFRKKKVHQHAHGHEEEDAHQHFHSHSTSPEHTPAHHQTHGIGKPFLRKKSYLVGTVHGVAGRNDRDHWPSLRGFCRPLAQYKPYDPVRRGNVQHHVRRVFDVSDRLCRWVVLGEAVTKWSSIQL